MLCPSDRFRVGVGSGAGDSLPGVSGAGLRRLLGSLSSESVILQVGIKGTL